MSDPFHEDLRLAARFLPRALIKAGRLPIIRLLTRVAPVPKVPREVTVRDVSVPGVEGAPPVRVRLYRPANAAESAPALLWMHGGGYLIGAPEQDERLSAENARELGIVIASVDYRLAPEHPFPAPLDDCDAALRWLFAQSDSLGIDPTRIAIGGASAGGGLAAALAQRALDAGDARPAFQLLIYPMLDDRTATRTDIDGRSHRAWNNESNLLGWSSYLGHPPGQDDVPAHAVPARRADSTGLPPAWLGVGTCDLFHDEDLEYARRLEESGVPCALSVVPGAFHGFDLIRPNAPVSREFRQSYLTALRHALFG